VPRSSRLSRAAILTELKRAARTGDRDALALAIEQMKLWALSPRYWQRYLDLLGHPLARLVDMTVIKQGDKIARQKGWVTTRRERAKPARGGTGHAGRPVPAKPVRSSAAAQASLFPDLR
jgi:hypothetical protein